MAHCRNRAHDFARAQREKFQQRILARCERNADAGTHGGARRAVEDEIAHGDARILSPVRAAAECLDAREQFFKNEWLRQIVIRPGAQPAHAIVHRIARGEDEDVRPGAARAQAAEDFEAIQAGQHQIEQHGVVNILLRFPQAILAIRGAVHGIARALQPGGERTPQTLGIFDDEQMHGGDVKSGAASGQSLTRRPETWPAKGARLLSRNEFFAKRKTTDDRLGRKRPVRIGSRWFADLDFRAPQISQQRPA